MGAETDLRRTERVLDPSGEHLEASWSWSVARQIALTRDEWRCVICGAPDWSEAVEVHHVVPVEDYRPGPQHDPAGLVTLCRNHHLELHRAMRSERDYQLSLIAA